MLTAFVITAVGLIAAFSVLTVMPASGADFAFQNNTFQNDICGDGVCGGKENCSTCTTDCCPENLPEDPPPGQTCGRAAGCDNDGVCEPECDEGSFNCGDCPSFCGDQICAPHEVNSCCGAGKDCTVAITCGDGICSACENNALCPGDCEQTVTTAAPPTTQAPPTDTNTPVIVTKAGVTGTPSTDTPTPRVPTNTPRATRTALPTATSTSTSTPEPEEVGCGLVPYESRSVAWQAAYATAAQPGGYIPVQEQDEEVWVCPVPPVGEKLCIPLYDNLPDVVDNDLNKIRLADCKEDGTCEIFEQVGTLEGNQFCYIVGEAGLTPTCEFGCALAPEEVEPTGLPWWLWLIALLLLLLLLILIFLLTRRRKDDEEDDSADFGGLSSRPPSGGGSPPTQPSPSRTPEATMIEQPPPSRGRDEDPSTLYIPPPSPPTDPH